jgi:acetyl esterase
LTPIAFAQPAIIHADNMAIDVNVYSPAPDQPLPVIVFFHGGGHMCGDIQLYDPICRRIAVDTNSILVAVEYRLAPEFPYPCGLQDAELAVEHVQQVLNDVNHNGTLAIAGDSAGGAICASLLMRMTDGTSLIRTQRIDKQILIYPSLDYTGSTQSYISNGTGYLLENTRIKWYFDHYFAANENRKNCSPLFGKLPAHYPATLLFTAGCDPLRDEGVEYGQRLVTAGIKLEHVTFPGLIHAFMNIESLLTDECCELRRKIKAFMAS